MRLTNLLSYDLAVHVGGQLPVEDADESRAILKRRNRGNHKKNPLTREPLLKGKDQYD